MSNVEVEERYQRALTAAGWEVPVHNRGGGLVAHYAKNDRDVWLKIIPGRETRMVIADAGARESAAKIAEMLGRQGRIALYGIYFDTGSAVLKPESESTLERVRQALTTAPALKVEVQGHTDNVGQRASNDELSAARAKAVMAWLVAHGIAAARLTSNGYADTKPVADNGSAEGRAKNRRVELATAR
jgi:outer membrane protein OmpA-like peptidoglycan-associated protein